MKLLRQSFLREYTCKFCRDHRWHDVEILKHGNQYIDLAKCTVCHYATTRYINLIEDPAQNPMDKWAGKNPLDKTKISSKLSLVDKISVKEKRDEYRQV